MSATKAEKDQFDLILDLTNGGRSLNAIWSRQNTSATQKIILLYIANRIDFTRSFTRFNSVSISQIMKNTSLSKKTVKANLKELLLEGLILAKTGIFKNGKQQSNKYALSVKLFLDYRDVLAARKAAKPADEDEGQDLSAALAELDESNDTGRGSQMTPPTGCKMTPPRGSQMTPPTGSQMTPPYSPKDSPKDSLVVVQGGSAAGTEAKQLLRSVYVPKNDRSGGKRFVRIEDIDSLALKMLEQFGIEAIRTFKAKVDELQLAGYLEWKPKEAPHLIMQASGLEVAPPAALPDAQLPTEVAPKSEPTQTIQAKVDAEREAYAEKHRRTILKMQEDAKLAWTEKQKKKHGGV